MKPLAAIAVLLLASCQPQARRLLLLDLNLTDPAALEATAEPWDAAGYAVEYRRFYPHLTRADLDRYRIVMVLGGREPEAPSDALGAGDLALITDWVPRGGVLVFGYAGDGEGFQDRWVMNRWLASMGAGITIGDFALADSAAPGSDVEPVRNRALRGAEFEPFPAGRVHVLLTEDETQALARAPRGAFVRLPGGRAAPRPHAVVVAADRIGTGLVVIASRHTLGALGPDDRATVTVPPDAAALARTRLYLTALARWTRRPAEWASLPVTRRPLPLSLVAAPRPVAPRPPRLAPPPGVTTARLPDPAPPDTSTPPGVPGWIRRSGVRAFWTRDFSIPALDSLAAFLETGAFNVLAAVADPHGADSLARRGATTRYWPAMRLRFLADRLQQTSVLWMPALDLGQLRPPPDAAERGIAGDTLPGWCTLDQRLWNEELVPAFVSLARLSATRADLIPGIALDLGRPEAALGMAAAFCDSTYAIGVRALGQDSAETARLVGLRAPERYSALLESGSLGRYYAALEGEVAARAAAIRTAVHRVRPDVRFAVRLADLPTDWLSLGLLRGLSGSDDPVLLWTREPRGRAVLARYRSRGIALVPAVRLTAAALSPRYRGRLRSLVFGENAGFWLAAEDTLGGAAGRLRADSLARLIRRLAKDLPRDPVRP